MKLGCLLGFHKFLPAIYNKWVTSLLCPTEKNFISLSYSEGCINCKKVFSDPMKEEIDWDLTKKYRLGVLK